MGGPRIESSVILSDYSLGILLTFPISRNLSSISYLIYHQSDQFPSRSSSVLRIDTSSFPWPWPRSLLAAEKTCTASREWIYTNGNILRVAMRSDCFCTDMETWLQKIKSRLRFFMVGSLLSLYPNQSLASRVTPNKYGDDYYCRVLVCGAKANSGNCLLFK